ncbi:MAG: DNA gyrase inhibitor YacG [Pyrinomonadaceae bacterium]
MKCPNCGKPTGWQDNPTRPFCSERCKLIDFGRWANEEYSVPATETMPPAESPEAIQEEMERQQ